MNYILDTHILLWTRLEPGRLSKPQRSVLESSADLKFVSTVTIWELSLKFSLGKLDLGGHTPEEFMSSADKLGLQIIPPTSDQFASFHRLPKNIAHKDPFDRMLIWQAIQSDMCLLSSDTRLAAYEVHGLTVV
jgi:PIN domain nuclease of toxin-antitoxin system